MRWTSLGGSGVALASPDARDSGGRAVVAARADALRSGSTYGRTSSPMRLTLMRCSGVMLSDVMLPPHEPGPSVIAGAKPVVYPTAPIATFELTMIRNA